MRLSDLSVLDPRELSSVYKERHPFRVPRGRYRGVHLAWIAQDREGVDWLHPALVMGFAWLPFGIDFDRRLWTFGHARVALGRFRMEEGESRWRAGRTLRLHYDVGRLPGFVRNWLYDEVKPLGDALCLGIGGINAPQGRGERFFFALEKKRL